MRVSNPYFIIALLLVSGILAAFTITQNPISTTDDGNISRIKVKSDGFGTAIGVVIDTNMYFLVQKKILIDAIEEDSISFSGFSEPGNIFVNKLNFLTYNYNKYYLFAEGNFNPLIGNSQVNFKIAYELVLNEGRLYTSAQNGGNSTLTIHMCTGDGCSSCGFDTDKDGSIIGCKCNSGNGTCEHRIIALDAVGSSCSLLDIFIPNNETSTASTNAK